MRACLYGFPAGGLYVYSRVDCLSPCPVKGLSSVVTDKVLVIWGVSAIVKSSHLCPLPLTWHGREVAAQSVFAAWWNKSPSGSAGIAAVANVCCLSLAFSVRSPVPFFCFSFSGLGSPVLLPLLPLNLPFVLLLIAFKGPNFIESQN